MIDETLFEAEEKMEKAVEVAKEAFGGIRTGRAHPGMFQKVLVDYYGAPTPLQQLASFQNPEARTIIISPFDKGSMHAIEKAIQQADLGVNPSNDGMIIRCVMPVLTEERRREYVKMAHHQAEDAKVAVRNVRRHAKTTLEKLVKDGDVGEDEGARAEKELEALTKRHVDQIEELLKHKEAELLEV
jgi:ribosome recycling factor